MNRPAPAVGKYGVTMKEVENKLYSLTDIKNFPREIIREISTYCRATFFVKEDFQTKK